MISTNVTKKTFTLKTKLWLYPGESASWHFLTLPKKESAFIKDAFGANSRGWGSLPVTVTIGKTTWETSIFPDRKSGTYLLPVKASVRKAEGLFVDDTISYRVKIR